MKIKKHLEENKDTYKPWIVDKNQGMVEWKILPYLQNIENGVFVEAGAHDGLFQSNTKSLSSQKPLLLKRCICVAQLSPLPIKPCTNTMGKFLSVHFCCADTDWLIKRSIKRIFFILYQTY